MYFRVPRRFAHWLALLAIVAASILPTVSRSMAAWPGELDLCVAGQPRGPAPSPGHFLQDHCPYCALQADWALPPPQAAVADADVRFHERPEAALRTPDVQACWSSSQPRAPPLSA